MNQSEKEARPDFPRAFKLAAGALLFPGLGHLLLGRRVRALIFFVLVAVAMLVGIALEGKLYRPVAGQPLSLLGTIGSMGMGVGWLALEFVLGYEGDLVAAGFDYGTAFLLTAGLMNLLLVIDVWDIALGRKE
ncbi:MAG: DUF6677 family protein [Acidobacteriota bacterium]